MSYEQQLVDKIRSVCHLRNVVNCPPDSDNFKRLITALDNLRTDQTDYDPTADAHFGSGRISKKLAQSSLSDKDFEEKVRKQYLLYCKNTTPFTVGDLEDFCYLFKQSPDTLLGITYSPEAKQESNPFVNVFTLDAIDALIKNKKPYSQSLNLVITSIPVIGVSFSVTIAAKAKNSEYAHYASFYYCDALSNEKHHLNNVVTVNEGWKSFTEALKEFSWNEYSEKEIDDGLNAWRREVLKINELIPKWHVTSAKIDFIDLDSKVKVAQQKASQSSR